MFDFDDDLIVSSHRIPWLVWIQLVVMLLLLILLYYLIAFALGLDPSPAASAVLRSGETSQHRPPPVATVVSSAAASSRLNSAKAGESHSIKGDVGTKHKQKKSKERRNPRAGRKLFSKGCNQCPSFGSILPPVPLSGVG